MDKREAANLDAAAHVERLRRRLAEGKDEIGRQRQVVDANRDHITDMSRWIEQTDRHLDEARAQAHADSSTRVDG